MIGVSKTFGGSSILSSPAFHTDEREVAFIRFFSYEMTTVDTEAGQRIHG